MKALTRYICVLALAVSTAFLAFVFYYNNKGQHHQSTTHLQSLFHARKSYLVNRISDTENAVRTKKLENWKKRRKSFTSGEFSLSDNLFGDKIVGSKNLVVRNYDYEDGEEVGEEVRGRFRSADDLIGSSNSMLFADSRCRMENCFNFSRCAGGPPYKHYIHPVHGNEADDSEDESSLPISPSYAKILDALRSSPNYTPNPEDACLFFLSLDTLDRDKLSESRYVTNMPLRLEKLSGWNEGRNHVVFNLYSGTYPDYAEDLGFDIGYGILAKASIAWENYRPGFDVSLPLFHEFHPPRGEGTPGTAPANFPATAANKFFLAFKGKRYLHGIGSETRNSLYHLHNGKDVVLVTTCKHGKNWRELQDERCEEDNEEYDRWDYDTLLANSTFCMVPRGRRLGSFRFLETLQAGCVPVLLSNDWRLPFGEVIDWKAATVMADERLLLQVPELLRSIPQSKVFQMRRQTQVLWQRYLSSVEKIVETTLEIIYERIDSGLQREGTHWNFDPGGLVLSPEYNHDRQTRTLNALPLKEKSTTSSSSHNIANPCGAGDGEDSVEDHEAFKFPFFGGSAFADDEHCQGPKTNRENFTAVIFASRETIDIYANSLNSSQNNFNKAYPSSSSSSNLAVNLAKLVRNVAASRYSMRIVLLWTSTRVPPPSSVQTAALSSTLDKGPDFLRIVTISRPKHQKGFQQDSQPNDSDHGIRFRHYEDDEFSTSSSSTSSSYQPNGGGPGPSFYNQIVTSANVIIPTDAVFSADADVVLSTEEIDFAFGVWRTQFRDRIVGYASRSVYWNSREKRWTVSTKLLNEYSMILPSKGAFYHRFYHFLYSKRFSRYAERLKKSGEPKNGNGFFSSDFQNSEDRNRRNEQFVNKNSDAVYFDNKDGKNEDGEFRKSSSSYNNRTFFEGCEDILFNFLVADVTKKPPVKLAQRRRLTDTEIAAHKRLVQQHHEQQADSSANGNNQNGGSFSEASKTAAALRFEDRQRCLNSLVDLFGSMPLRSSLVRLDPVLFKDQVSNSRKKYKRMENQP